MNSTSLLTLFFSLILCLLASAFFSMAETAMMAINRYRLASRAQAGSRPAQCIQTLLMSTDKLLSMILLGNTIINSIAAMLATIIAFKLAGQDQFVLGIATALISFSILVFSEATPKVIAATHPELIAYFSCYPLVFLLKLFYPIVWFINLFVAVLLRLLRVKRKTQDQTLSLEELRFLVLESEHYMETKHHSILLNLFELSHVTVNDVMTPRNQIEAIDLNESNDEICKKIFTCHHTALPAYTESEDNIVGILHARKILSMQPDEINADSLKKIMRPPYFIPSSTPLFVQLQYFQENHHRIGLVVDEYGELLGLVTIEDVLEQIIGEFTTNLPTEGHFEIQGDGTILIDGVVPLRTLNQKLKTYFPVDGPKTLNGLILEYFEAIPEPGTCLFIGNQRLEVLQTQDRSIRTVRLYPQISGKV